MNAGKYVRLGFVLIGILLVFASFVFFGKEIGLIMSGSAIIIALVLTLFTGNVKVTVDKTEEPQQDYRANFPLPQAYQRPQQQYNPYLQVPQQQYQQQRQAMPMPIIQESMAVEDPEDETDYGNYDVPPEPPQGYIPQQMQQQTIPQQQQPQQPRVDPFQDLEREIVQRKQLKQQLQQQVTQQAQPQQISQPQQQTMNVIKCKICGKEFRNVAEYKRHYGLKHSVIPNPGE